MKKNLCAFVLSLLSLSACAEQKNQISQDVAELSFAGRTISLVNDDGLCALKRSDDSQLRLDVKWPCQFSKNLQGKELIEDYPGAQIFMVQHSKPAAPPEKRCETDLQAIRYYKGKVDVAPLDRVGACPPRRFDQKVFVAWFDW